MTPTLTGRLQTRSLLAVLAGVPSALLAAAFLDEVGLGDALAMLLVITLLGLLWEVCYDRLQQLRWDRDWPALFRLASGVPEALVAWPVLGMSGLMSRSSGSYALFFAVVWVATWLAEQGPLAVLLPRWRHQGGRVLAPRATSVRLAEVAWKAPAQKPAKVAPALTPAPVPAGDATPRAEWLRPTRQRVLVLAACVVWGLGIVLLAPMIGGGHDREDHPHQAQAAVDTQRVVSPARLQTWDTRERVLPKAVEFRAISMRSRLDNVVLTDSGALSTPSPARAAWFRQGAAPGQRGAAVLIGSTDSVFAGLDTAEKGQRLQVARGDGSQVTFVVDEVLEVDSTDFPTERVYERSMRPLLRMVGYDPETGRNVIVFAHATALTTAPAGA